MTLFPRIFITSLVGIFAGIIFTVLLMGWPFSPHGVANMDWTMRALVPGIIWGGMNGIVVGLVQNVVSMTPARRIITGGMIGGISGFTYDLANSILISHKGISEPIDITLWTTLGIVGGMISGIVVRKCQQMVHLLKNHYFFEPEDERIFSFQDKPLSIFTGTIIGLYFGAIATFFTGMYKLIFEDIRYGYQFFWIYNFCIIGGCIGIVFSFIKPLTHSRINKVVDGAMTGLLSGILAFVFFIIVLLGLAIQELEDIGIVLIGLLVLGIPTIVHGIVTGMISELIKDLITRLKPGNQIPITGS